MNQSKRLSAFNVYVKKILSFLQVHKAIRVQVSPAVLSTVAQYLGFITLISSMGIKTVHAAADVIAVDLSQIFTLDMVNGDLNYGSKANDDNHPVNRYDLFCKDNDAAKPTKDWQRSLPEILSSYVKIGSDVILPSDAMNPGSEFSCVGQEMLKKLAVNLSNIENLHKFIKEDPHVKQTETKLTWTTNSGLELSFFGIKTETAVDVSQFDATKREMICTDLKGDYDASTNRCAGKLFTVSDFTIKESFWHLGRTDGKYTSDIFNPALSIKRKDMLDQFNGLDWALRSKFFNRLAIENTSTDSFETYYYCQSSNTRLAGSRDYACGDSRTIWLDSSERPLIGTATELVRSRETLSESLEELKLHVLQTGPGNCIVLECPGNEKAVLVDCGSLSKRLDNASLFGVPPNFDNNTNADTERLITADARVGKAKSLAHAQNILRTKKEIALFVSHGDADHKNLLYNIFYEDNGAGVSDLYKKIESFYFGGNFQKTSDDAKTNQFFARLFNHFDSTAGKFVVGPGEVVGGINVPTKSLPRFFASAGNRREDSYSRKPAGFKTYTTPLSTGPTEVCKVGGVGAEVKIAAANEYGREVGSVRGVARDPNPGLDWTKKNSHTTNGNSIILEIEYAGKRIVIPGDAESGALNWAVDAANPDRISGTADILLASHHGASGHGAEENSNITQNWVNTLNPAYLIYTHGHQYGHPKLGTLGEADGRDVKTKANTEESPGYFRPGSKLESQADATGQTERQIRFNNNDGDASVNRKVYNVKSNVYSTMAQGSLTFSIDAGGKIKVNCLGPTITPWEVKAGKNAPGYCKPLE